MSIFGLKEEWCESKDIDETKPIEPSIVLYNIVMAGYSNRFGVVA